MKKIQPVIYKIENILNNKVYIGQTNCFSQRRGSHLHNLRKNKHPNKHLQAAYNQYGEDKLIFSIVVEVLQGEDIDILEQFYIDKYNVYDNEFGYNTRIVGKSNLGIKMGPQKPEHVAKRTASMLATRELNGTMPVGEKNPNYGKVQTLEKRKKISKSEFPGTKFNKKRNRWTARPWLNGKEHWLGQFKTREEAYSKVLEFLNENGIT